MTLGQVNGPRSMPVPPSTSTSATNTNRPVLVLEPLYNKFPLKSIDLPDNTRVKIGRQTGVTTQPHPSNGYFDSKVLSRIHAEVWSDQGQVYIRDLKSSNGTFLNHKRLSPENTESEPFLLNQNDSLEFGIDIMDEHGALLHEKVACKIYISRMAYPTPSSSPQESQIRQLCRTSSPPLRPMDSNPFKAGSGLAGQSVNMDLMLSRLQSELLRSQETQADLGLLKQGLAELEKVVLMATPHDPSKPTPPPSSSPSLHTTPSIMADMEKMMKQKTEEHDAALERLNQTLAETRAELEASSQRIKDTEPLVHENKVLTRDLDESANQVSFLTAERDQARERIRQLEAEYQQAMEDLSTAQAKDIQALVDAHQDEIQQLIKEADQERVTMEHEHKEALVAAAAAAVAAVSAKQPSPPLNSSKDPPQSAEDQVEQAQERLHILKTASDGHVEAMEALLKEKTDLVEQLRVARADLARVTKEKESQQQQPLRDKTMTDTPHSGPSSHSVKESKESPWSSWRSRIAYPRWSITLTDKDRELMHQYSFVFMSLVAVLLSGGTLMILRKAGIITS